MYRPNILISIILISCFLIAVPCRACNLPPTADIADLVKHEWENIEIIFDGSGSSDPDGTIIKYEWRWYDDYIEDIYDYVDISGSGMASHTYIVPDTYIVTLRVTDNLGATDTDTCEVHVYTVEGRPYFYVSKTGDDNWDGTAKYDLGNNVGPKRTIQATLNMINNDAAIDIAIVEVGEGTYEENIVFGNKNILLTSTHPYSPPKMGNDTIIEGNGSTSVVTFSGNESLSCQLRGFTIKNGIGTYIGPYDRRGGGIFGNHAKPTISHCIITENTANIGGGIAECDGVIRDCIIVNNSLYGEGGGIANCNSARIYNCLIANNHSYNYGAGLHNCQDCFITNCTIAYNDGIGIADCTGSSTIANCIIWGNDSDQISNCVEPKFSCIQNYLPSYQDIFAYWKLDEGSGDTTSDYSGHGYHATLENGPAWGDGMQSDASVYFDGSNDYAKSVSSTAFDFTDKVSVAHWFKANANDNAAGRGLVNRGASVYKYMTYLTTNSGALIFYIRQPSGICGAGTGDMGANYWADGQWHFIVGTFVCFR